MQQRAQRLKTVMGFRSATCLLSELYNERAYIYNDDNERIKEYLVAILLSEAYVGRSIGFSTFLGAGFATGTRT